MRSKSVKIVALITVLLLGVLLSSCGNASGAADSVRQRDFTSSKISYLGPAGTYTEEAAKKFFGGKGTYVPCDTVEDAVSQMIMYDSSYAVIPQENTIGGPVTDYIDTLIKNRGNVSVVGEVELTINQNLLILPDADLSDIKTVYSHKQGIAQGAAWLKENLPDAEVIEVGSTAEGAKMAAESGDKSCAAIASAGCADVYGLKVAASAIQMNDQNVTRFYVLSNDPPLTSAGPGADCRIVFIVSGKSEDLLPILSSLEQCGAKLVAVHDRPQTTELGRYDYVIEVEDTDYACCRKATSFSKMYVTYLGMFESIR